MPVAAVILAFVPFEPEFDCTAPHAPVPSVVILDVRDHGGDIRWDGEKITREQFKHYLVLEQRERTPKERDVFRVYRDDASVIEATAIVRELSKAGLFFGKNCLPVP